MRKVQQVKTGISGEPVGFIGLGVMGTPMAMNLIRAGTPLVVWNRTIERTDTIRAMGATVASSIDNLFIQTKTIIVMLVDSDAIDQSLGRGTSDFAQRVADHTIICMSSVAPDYAIGLARDVIAAGGQYVEAPVSGSRKPAEAGKLVGLLAGEPALLASVRPLFAPMCCETVLCGDIGDGLRMKLAINMYLNSMLVALAEATHFAAKQQLDLTQFAKAIQAGPMASAVTAVKLPKLVQREFSVQAATSDAFTSCCLIADAAQAIGVASPLLDISKALYREAVDLGYERMDMVSVLAAIEARSVDALFTSKSQTEQA